MIDLLSKLSKGVDKEDIPKKFENFIKDLIRLKALKLKNGNYKLNKDYRFGIVDINRSGVGFLETISTKKTKDLVIASKDLLNSSKGDIVLAKRIYSNQGRPKAKVIYIIQQKDTFQIVYTKSINRKIIGINIKTGLQNTIAASQKSLKQLPLNTILKIDSKTSCIVEVLGVLDDPKVDEKISLALFDKKEEFSQKSELEAKSFGNFVDKSMYPNRVDLTHLPFCTIDPVTAKDFDDAIYFDEKEMSIYIAIADVSEYVFYQGNIDKEAKKRGFSIYFPHKSIPMLPRSLSENICSLKPNEDRLTFTYKITLDPKSLKVINEELFESIICSKKRYNYNEIDKILENNKIDNERFSYIFSLNRVTKKLRQIRLEKGYDFRSSEIKMYLDNEQNLLKTTIESETPSHSLIEECMLLANKAAAKMIDVGIFRIHESPAFDDIAKLLEQVSKLGIFVKFQSDLHLLINEIQKEAKILNLQEDVDKLIIRAQKQAKYTSQNKGHFGLGFEKYTHFTSPIRRYSDLMLHRLLKSKLQNDDKFTSHLLENIESLCNKLSELERESDKVAYDFMDRKYARWAEKNINSTIDARISNINSTAIATTIGDIKGARVYIAEENLELFQDIKLKIIDSDIASTKILGSISYNQNNLEKDIDNV